MRVRAITTGLIAVALAATPAQAAPQQVLYVGDSLGVGTTPAFAKVLGSSAAVHGDSRGGRPSPEGLAVVRQRFSAADDVVVFALGTNDDPARPAQLASDLAAARPTRRERCLLGAVLSGPPLNGVPVDGLNAAVEQF